MNILQTIYFSNSNHFLFFENNNNNNNINNNNSNLLSIPKFQKIIELSKQKRTKKEFTIEELKQKFFEIIFEKN